MVNWFDKLYSSIINRNSFLNKIRFYSVLRFIIRSTANIALPIYFKLTFKNINYTLEVPKNKENRIIVTLTSFPARINKLWLVIETIFRQTTKPDIIILWLSKEQFPHLSSLPQNLLNMQKRGLKIELRDGDLRSHKKYYYVLQEFPKDTMITIDDDIFYRNNMIETLLEYSEKYPECIISNFSHKIIRKNNKIESYKKWIKNIKYEDSGFDLFFGSGGGTLFPVNSLYSEVLNTEIFMSICSKADDVWLNVMARLNNTSIIKTDYYSAILPVINVNNRTLASMNIEYGNDKQITAVRKYYMNTLNLDPFILNNFIQFQNVNSI